MERKIGETFEFEGKTLQVKSDSNDGCEGCFFNMKCTREIKSVTGRCRSGYRNDKKNVIFVEVQEQEEAEEPKERKVGETFVYQGKKLKVVQTKGSICNNCYFECRDCDCENIRKVLGACVSETRTDNKPVIFVEVKEEAEEPEEQMQEEPQKLNLCEILKDCPMYEPFWSPMLGNVKFHHIDHEAKRILITLKTGTQWNINPDATITFANVTSPEIMLYPSKEQRDWSKFTAPWLKKERFDPKTLKAFDRVVSRNNSHHIWTARVFSHIDSHPQYKYICGNDHYKICIPYNDDTKHLVGTTEEAPDFYKYWED